MPLARRLAATASFVLACAFSPIESAVAWLAPPIASIDPHVPAAAGAPCVVHLLNHRNWPQQYVDLPVDPVVNYNPPASCPPPWSKVILKLHVKANRRSVLDSIGMDLANVRLFDGLVPAYGGASNWYIERDLTDYSALFKTPQSGLIWSTQEAEDSDGIDTFALNGSAELLFYPATSATPAPRVPDVVIGVNQDIPASLPTNIERAYLDVDTDAWSANFWFTCYSDDTSASIVNVINADFAPGVAPFMTIFPPQEGCGGGSFAELKIGLDDIPAGIAPMFPLLPADMNWLVHNGADQPITTLEMPNSKPYRVDLTPFAAVLSTASPHAISVDPYVFEGAHSGGATLLLYLDPHSTQVTGAVTLNTLATGSGTPTDVNNLQLINSYTVRGDIKTQQHRDFDIRGFVHTSHGDIYSRVHQVSHFSSTQVFNVITPPLQYNIPVNWFYSQNIWLTQTVKQTSSRTLGGQLISWDQTRVRYPIEMLYSVATQDTDLGDTELDGLMRSNILIKQKRIIDYDHYQPGLGHFVTHTADRFYSLRKAGADQPDPYWESSTRRHYKDNFGSCYHARMNSYGGAITARSFGDGCPMNHNWVIWFAHPDGSPDGFDW